MPARLTPICWAWCWLPTRASTVNEPRHHENVRIFPPCWSQQEVRGMSIINRRLRPRLASWVAACLLAVTGSLVGLAGVASAQTAARDGIADLIQRKPDAAGQPPQAPPAGANAAKPAADATAEAGKDPREGDANYEQAQRLMKAVDAILQDTARHRGEAKKLPA